MNESNVTLNFTTDQTGDVTTGTTTWSGNTLTFTPSPRWEYGRSYTVQVAGSDTLGNVLGGNVTLTFSTKTGYKIDTSFPSTDLGMLVPTLVPNSNEPGVIAIDPANEVLVPSGGICDKFSATGTLLGTLPIQGTSLTSDALNNIWSLQGGVGNVVLNQYDVSGNLIMSNSCGTLALGAEYVCIDDTRSIAYLSGGGSPIVLGVSTTGGSPLCRLTTSAPFPQSRAAIDSAGFVYLILQQPSTPTPNAVNTIGKFQVTDLDPVSIPLGNLLSTFTVQNNLAQIFDLGVAVDPHNTLYVCSQDFIATSTSPQAVRFTLFDSTGHVFTTFTYPIATFTNLTGQIAVDGLGNIYVVDSTAYQRLVPDP